MTKNGDIGIGWTETPFLADIYIEKQLVAIEVRAMLRTSALTYDRPKILLYPTDSQYSVLTQQWQMEIKGFTRYVNNEKSGEIHALISYVDHAEKRSFGPSWAECLIHTEAAELYQKQYLRGESGSDDKGQITFFLTDAKGVTPSSVTRSYTGEVKPANAHSIILDLRNGWTGKFERHYQYAETELEGEKGSFSSSQLVLVLEREGGNLHSTEEAQRLGECLDDLLWYLSFAGRQRVTWIKWTALIDAQLVQYARSMYVPRRTADDELIELWDLQEFLQHCLDYMQKKENLGLYVPLLNVVAAERRETVESKFMSLYTALEALLFSYATKLNRNKHFSDENEWKAFKEDLVKTIKSSENLRDGEKGIMLQKLGIFNQKSLQTLYVEFCNDFFINNSDLWPIFHGGFSLSRIRNKLVHGEELQREELEGVSIAEENLRWIVERCLLGIIGWKKAVRITSPSGLGIYTAYRDWTRYFNR